MADPEATAPSQIAAAREPILPKGWTLPEAFRRRMGDEAGRQRAMVAEGHLLLVLHTPPRPEEVARAGRVYWRNDEGAWKPAGIKHGGFAVGELLGEYERALDEIDAAVDHADTAQEAFGVLTRLNPLVRAAHNAYHALQDARQHLPEARELILLRDRAYAMSRRADLLQTDAKNALEFVIARRSEEQADSARRQSRAAHRLNVLAALFFPIVTLTSILGTNLGHGLESLDQLHSPLPLLIVLGVGLLLGMILTSMVTRQ